MALVGTWQACVSMLSASAYVWQSGMTGRTGYDVHEGLTEELCDPSVPEFIAGDAAHDVAFGTCRSTYAAPIESWRAWPLVCGVRL